MFHVEHCYYPLVPVRIFRNTRGGWEPSQFRYRRQDSESPRDAQFQYVGWAHCPRHHPIELVYKVLCTLCFDVYV